MVSAVWKGAPCDMAQDRPGGKKVFDQALTKAPRRSGPHGDSGPQRYDALKGGQDSERCRGQADGVPARIDQGVSSKSRDGKRKKP